MTDTPKVQATALTVKQLLTDPNFNRDNMSTYTFKGNHVDHEFMRMAERVAMESTTYSLKNNESYRNQFAGSKYMAKAMDVNYDISSDTSENLREFDSMIQKPLRPNLIGRMMLPNKPVSKPVGQFRYFNKKGKAEKTARNRGSTYQSRADRSIILEYRADDEILTKDHVDTKFREDEGASAISEHFMSIGETHHEEISEYCVEALVPKTTTLFAARFGTGTWTDGSGNSQPKGINYDSDTTATNSLTASYTLDTLVDVVTKGNEKNWSPDTALMSWDGLGKLLKTEDFQRADYFQDHANWGDTPGINRILGLTVYATSQFPSAIATAAEWIAYERSRYICLTIRRDNLIEPFENREDGIEGVKWSSRVGTFCKYGECAIRVHT